MASGTVARSKEGRAECFAQVSERCRQLVGMWRLEEGFLSIVDGTPAFVCRDCAPMVKTHLRQGVSE